MKKFVFLLVGMLLITLAIANVNIVAQDDPPMVPGNWNVNTLTYVNDTTLGITGNIYVNSGGILKLSNVTLHINCSTDNEFGLTVYAGGMLFLDNGSMISDHQTTSIAHPYDIYIEDGGYLEMNNTIIEQAGNVSNYGNMHFEGDVNIQNSTFRDCYYGLYLYEWNPASFYMKNTLITNITGVDPVYGLFISWYTDVYFENVLVDGVYTTGTSTPVAYGVYHDISSSGEISGIEVTNVTSESAYGFYFYKGVTTIKDLVISNISGYDAWGMYFEQSPSSTYAQDLVIMNITATNNAYGLEAWYWDVPDYITGCYISRINGSNMAHGIVIDEACSSINNCTVSDIFSDTTAYGIRTKSWCTLDEVVDVDVDQVATPQDSSSNDAYGIYINEPGTTLMRCDIENVSSYDAHGLYLYDDSPLVHKVNVSNINGSKNAYGIYMGSSSTVITINNLTIQDIYAELQSGPKAYGIYCYGYVDEIADVLVRKMDSMDDTYGIYVRNSGTEIHRCELYELNSSYIGSSAYVYGLYFYWGMDLVADCYIHNLSSNYEIEGIFSWDTGHVANVTVEHFYGGRYIYAIHIDGSTGTIKNSTVRFLYQNTTYSGTALKGFYIESSSGLMENCTAYDLYSNLGSIAGFQGANARYCYAHDFYSEESSTQGFYSVEDIEYCTVRTLHSTYQTTGFFDNYADIRNCLAEDLIGRYCTGADGKYVTNVTVRNVYSTGECEVIEGWKRAYDCHIKDIFGGTGYGISGGSTGIVENCTIENLAHIDGTDISDYAVYGDEIKNVTVTNYTGGVGFYGCKISNSSIWNCVANGVFLWRYDSWVENCSFVNVWGDALQLGGQLYNTFIKNNDFVGFSGYCIYNDEDNDLNVNMEQNYFGIQDTDVLNASSYGSITLGKTADKPFFPKPFIFVNTTKTWTGGTYDFKNVLIVNGALTISNAKIEGEILVTGSLNMTNVTVGSGLALSSLWGSSGSVNGLTSLEGNGTMVHVSSSQFSLSNFDLRGYRSAVRMRDASHTDISNGTFTAYGDRSQICIRIWDSKDIKVSNVNASGYWLVVNIWNLKHGYFEKMAMTNNTHGFFAHMLYYSRIANSTMENEWKDAYSAIWIENGSNVHIHQNRIINCGFFEENYPSNPDDDEDYRDIRLEFDHGTFIGNYVRNDYSNYTIGNYDYQWPGYIGESTNITVKDNYFENNNVIDIRLKNSIFDNNTVVGTHLIPIYNTVVFSNNSIRNSSMGLTIKTPDNLITNNTFYNNSDTALYITTSFNTIYHNNFVKNFRNVQDYGSNTYSSNFDEGNYWDNYIGSDLNGDGIGDTNLPHMMRDNYPFIYENGWKLKPFNPVLEDPGAVSYDGSYTISWSYANMASTYLLQESNTSDFSSTTEWSIPFFAANKMPITSKDFQNKNNGTYYYRIKGFNRNGETNWSNTQHINVAIPPGTPVIYISTFISYNGTIIIPWTTISNVTHYTVQESINKNFTDTNDYNTTLTYYKFVGRNNGTYYYRVRAVSNDRIGSWSQFVVFSVLIPPEMPDLNLTVFDSRGNYIVWWEPVLGATSYLLKERPLGGMGVQFVMTETSFNITGKPDGVYYYSARANSPTGWSDWSPEMEVVVDWAPNPPELVVKQVEEGNALLLEWDFDQGDITNISTEYNHSSLGWTELARLNKTKYGLPFTWEHTGLTDGVEYTYRVFAYDQGGSRKSSPSNVAKNMSWDSKPPKSPSIVNLGLLAEGGGIRVTWQEPFEVDDDLEGYCVYFSSDGKDYTNIKTTNASTYEYIKMNLTNGQYYYFYVTTYDEVPNESPRSAIKARFCDKDTDGDDDPNMFDDDDDGDGWNDIEDEFPLDPTEHSDNDKDGIGDNSDDDDDNDGYPDYVEETFYADPMDRDSVPSDIDGDFIPDAMDDDMDNDGHNNTNDAFEDDPSAWKDTDGDGKPDFINGTSTTGLILDEDIDNDGLSNEKERSLGTDPYIPDSDGDGVIDGDDSFPLDESKQEKEEDEDIVFTVFGFKVSKFDLLTTVIGILFTVTTALFGVFMLTVKTRRFRRHRVFIQKLDEKRELYDYFMTVCMADIEKEKLKPNDAVLLRHDYTIRMEQLGGGDEYEIYDAVAIAPKKKKKKGAAVEKPVEKPREPVTPAGPVEKPEELVPPEVPPLEEDLEVQDTAELEVDETEVEQPQQMPGDDEIPPAIDEEPAVEQDGDISLGDAELDDELKLDDDLFADLLKDDNL